MRNLEFKRFMLQWTRHQGQMAQGGAFIIYFALTCHGSWIMLLLSTFNMSMGTIFIIYHESTQQSTNAWPYTRFLHLRGWETYLLNNALWNILHNRQPSWTGLLLLCITLLYAPLYVLVSFFNWDKWESFHEDKNTVLNSVLVLKDIILWNNLFKEAKMSIRIKMIWVAHRTW